MNSRLLRFAAVTALAFVLSRVLGLVRDMIISARAGLGVETDAYVLALLIPDLLYILMSGGALGSAVIPIFVRLRSSGADEDAWDMASGVLVVVGVAVAGLAVVAWIFAPFLINDVLGGRTRNAETRELAVELMRIVLLQPVFLSLASVAAAVLQAFDRFTIPAFAPIAYNSSIIFGAAVLYPHLGMHAVALGVVVGGLLYLVTQVPLALRLGLRPPRAIPWRNPHVLRTFRLLAPRIVGQAAVQLNAMVAMALAAGLGEARTSAFRWAWTLFVLPVGLFATSVATVAFPTLSRDAAEQDIAGFSYLLERSVRGILFLVLPASVGLILLREPIISVLYEHGRFTNEDTRLTATPLLFFALGMWAYALVDILPRAFYALEDSVTPLKIALATVAFDVVLSFALVERFGLGGLSFAFALAAVLQSAALAYVLRARLRVPTEDDIGRFALKALLATAVMAAALWIARPLFANYQSLGFIALALRVVLTIVGAAAVYVGSSIVLKQEEVRTLLRVARR